MRRTLRAASAAVLSLAAACGGSDGSSDGSPDGPRGPDGPLPADAPVDLPMAPPTITLTGTAIARGIGGANAVPGAVIAGYRNTDESTPLATTTTALDGTFSLTVPTGGLALDGFLKATKAGFKDTYLYPAAPLAADSPAPVNMIAANDYDLLSTLAQGNQQVGNGMIALVVVDGALATSTPIAGATVSSTPASGRYRYNVNDLPDSQATATSADGVAYMFNVPPNVTVTVTAMKPGVAFKAHGLKARPDQVTTTLITP